MITFHLLYEKLGHGLHCIRVSWKVRYLSKCTKWIEMQCHNQLSCIQMFRIISTPCNWCIFFSILIHRCNRFICIVVLAFILLKSTWTLPTVIIQCMCLCLFILIMLQIKEMSEPLHIGADLETMLKFYHDLGKIVYFGSLSEEKRDLNDVVILDPQLLVDIFKGIITIAEPEPGVSHIISWKLLH